MQLLFWLDGPSPMASSAAFHCRANGYPSTDVAYWKRVIAVIKKHGLNHIRFYSWCPPEAAFIAADELGGYLQVEHAWTDPAAGKYLSFAEIVPVQ